MYPTSIILGTETTKKTRPRCLSSFAVFPFFGATDSLFALLFRP